MLHDCSQAHNCVTWRRGRRYSRAACSRPGHADHGGGRRPPVATRSIRLGEQDPAHVAHRHGRRGAITLTPPPGAHGRAPASGYRVLRLVPESGLGSYTWRGSTGGINDRTTGRRFRRQRPAHAAQLSASPASAAGYPCSPTLIGAITVPTNTTASPGTSTRRLHAGRHLQGTIVLERRPHPQAQPRRPLPAPSITKCVRSDGSGISFRSPPATVSAAERPAARSARASSALVIRRGQGTCNPGVAAHQVELQPTATWTSPTPAMPA